MALVRGRGPALSQVEGNQHSGKIPGGNLISALIDRRLMAWSDRGGASRYFGDRWSELCNDALVDWIGLERPVPGSDGYVLESVVRLDDDPRIAIQAGRHKLTNPDFVLFGVRDGAEKVLQAADAKFAVDTIKSAQVSADALSALLDVEAGLVQQAIEQRVGAGLLDDARIEQGVFLSPISPLTDFYLPRLLTDPRLNVQRDEIILIPVSPTAMFTGSPLSTLIGPLARIDRLPQTPRENLLAAMYYFRIACASAWMWLEERTPLLSLSGPPSLEADSLVNEVSVRSRTAKTAYSLVEAWSQEIDDLTRSRQALTEVASVPVSMREIREMVEARRGGEDRRLVRLARGSLDRVFRERLIAEHGEIPARPDQPFTDVLESVALVSRSLRPEMRRAAARIIDDLAAGIPDTA